MRSVLLSNIPHYHHLAESLHEEGILERYITAFTLLDGEAPPPYLPGKLKRKLEGRRLHGVPSARVKRCRTPEVLQRTLPALGLCHLDTGNWLNNHLFDWMASKLVPDCDVFHFISSIGLYSARLARKKAAKIICDVRQEHPSFQRRILEDESRRFNVPAVITGALYERKILEEFELADLIIVPSEHAKRTYLSAGIPATKLATLPYGVDLDVFDRHAKSDSKFRVLYSGSITLRKGPQYLLEAFRRLSDPNAELVLAGPLDPNFKPILARYEGSFRYAGVLPKLELANLYADASVFVLPSLADSFSLGTLEAMACAIPVIVSENTGVSEFVDNGKHGFVVPIRDSQTILEKLMYLRDNSVECAEMGLRAAERARELTWSRYGQKGVAIHRNLVVSEAAKRPQVFANV